MKIIADTNIPFLEGRLEGADLVRLPASEIDGEAVREADALIVRTRTRCNEALLNDSKVKIIATATIGTDHIDLEWCAANGIAVANAPGCNAPGVALYVWNCLLRNGFDPDKNSLGVVGCGNVGGIVAEWGERLGARVLVCDPPRKEAGLTDRDYLSLQEVLSQADAVTLHTPLTHDGLCPTFHLIDSHSLSSLKPGAIFINAARGEVAETEALIGAIEDGRIRHAVIDTWEDEPSIDRRLLQLATAATTHIAGYSMEGKQRASRMALQAVGECLGLHSDLSGLQGPYVPPAELTPRMIIDSYDPRPMTEALKKAPSDFERLRNAYPLHKEIL